MPSRDTAIVRRAVPAATGTSAQASVASMPSTTPGRARLPILMRRAAAEACRAAEWQAIFALELQPHGARGVSAAAEYLVAQATLLSRFDAGEVRAGVGGRRLELRYLASPGGETTVALIGGVSGVERRTTLREARAFAATVTHTLTQVRPRVPIRIPGSLAEVARWRLPFVPRHLAELDRASSVADWDGVRGPISSEALLEALRCVSAPTLVSICVMRADDASVVELTAEVDRPLIGTSGAVATVLEEFRLSETARRIAGLRSAAFEVRVTAASTEGLDESLLTTIAAEAGGAGRFGIAGVLGDSALRGARLPSWRRVRSAAGASDRVVATANLLWQRADPWGDAAKGVRRLADLRESACLFALPAREGATGGVGRIPTDAPLVRDGLRLGSSFASAAPVLVSTLARLRHLWIVGMTGTGKSTLDENLIQQSMLDPEQPAVIVFDAHGTLSQRVLGMIPIERRDDVVVLSPGDTERPVTLNPLDVPAAELPAVIRNFIELLYALFDPYRQGIVGPMFEHNLRNAILLVVSKPGSSLVDVMRVLSDDDAIAEFLPHVNDPHVLAWVRERASMDDKQKADQRTYYVSKIGPFVTDAVVRRVIGAPRSSFSIDEVLAHGRILIVDLNKGELGDIARFLSLVILPMIQRALMRRPAADRARSVYLFIDEFQNFASPALSELLAEGRKFGCGLVLSNQHAAQLAPELYDAVLGNVANIVSFRVGLKDAPMLAAAIGLESVEQAADLVRLPNFTAAASLLVESGPSAPFAFRTDPPVPSDDELAARIRQRSRELWGDAVTAPSASALADPTREPAEQSPVLRAQEFVDRSPRPAPRRAPARGRQAHGAAPAHPKGEASASKGEIRPLSRDLIKRVLDSHKLRYLIDDDGDFCLRFERNEEAGVVLTLWIIIGGTDETILTFRSSADKTVAAERKLELLAALDEWHRSRRWPKAYTADGDHDLEVVCEHTLELSAGTTEADAHTQLVLVMAASEELYAWLHNEKSLI